MSVTKDNLNFDLIHGKALKTPNNRVNQNIETKKKMRQGFKIDQ